jgi:hypothetical protein
MAVGAGALLVLILVGGLLARGREPASTNRVPVGVLASGPRTLQAQVQPAACGELRGTTEQVRGLLSRGQLAVAVALAADALTQHAAPACPEAHAALARVWYAADVDDLLATAVDDEWLSRRTPTRWTAIESRADELGVPSQDRRHPMALARTAYDRGLWPLADAAFRRAWDAGEVGVGAVEFRHALLRNWGHRLAFRGPPGVREQGLGLLATAHAVAGFHALQTDVACADLRALGVADCAGTPADPGEPALTGRRPGGAGAQDGGASGPGPPPR